MGRSGGGTERRRLQGRHFSHLPQCSAKAIGLRAGLEDVGLVGEPVQGGLAQPGVGKNPWPLGKRQVAGYERRRPFSVVAVVERIER
jgi:hypothetical protein